MHRRSERALRGSEVKFRVSTVEDITERRRAEEEFRVLLESALDAMVIVNTSGEIVLISDQAERLFGYSRGELVGSKVEKLVPERFRGQHGSHRNGYFANPRARAMGEGDLEFYGLAKDGREFPMEISLSPIETGGGMLIVTAIRDITERKQVEAQLIQSAKLATLGELAAGVAHELNQPLNIIRMAADSCLILAEEGKSDHDYELEHLQLIAKQCQRMADIISHLRVFGRKDELEPVTFNPVESVRDAVELVSEQYRIKNINVCAQMPKRCRQVRGHPNHLDQVLVNLLTNAHDAILEHGADTRGEASKERGRIDVSVRDDRRSDSIRITVTDTGGGIPEEDVDRVFDPFFTTKEVGRGTGLGLSVSYGIVVEMGGRIEARNVERGAEFVITMPVYLRRRRRNKGAR